MIRTETFDHITEKCQIIKKLLAVVTSVSQVTNVLTVCVHVCRFMMQSFQVCWGQDRSLCFDVGC